MHTPIYPVQLSQALFKISHSLWWSKQVTQTPLCVTSMNWDSLIPLKNPRHSFQTLMIHIVSQIRICASGNKAINWTGVYQHTWRHMASLGLDKSYWGKWSAAMIFKVAIVQIPRWHKQNAIGKKRSSPGTKMGTWKSLRVHGFMIDPESIGVLKKIKPGCHDGNLGELFSFA